MARVVTYLSWGDKHPERAAATSNLNSLDQAVHADLVRHAVLAEAKIRDFDRQPDTVGQLERVRYKALVRLRVAIIGKGGRAGRLSERCGH